MNINRPKLVAQIIAYLLDHELDFTKQKRYRFDNGEDILRKLGYPIRLIPKGEAYWCEAVEQRRLKRRKGTG